MSVSNGSVYTVGWNIAMKSHLIMSQLMKDPTYCAIMHDNVIMILS